MKYIGTATRQFSPLLHSLMISEERMIVPPVEQTPDVAVRLINNPFSMDIKSMHARFNSSRPPVVSHPISKLGSHLTYPPVYTPLPHFAPHLGRSLSSGFA